VSAAPLTPETTDLPIAPVDAPADPLIGRVVGGYRIDARLGEGGMGTVYRATQLSLERSVALKVLAEDLTSDPEFAERFLREARAAAALDHPNVVAPIDFFEAEGRLFFAMELMEGGSASDRLALGRRFVERDAVDIAIAVARALEFAEGRGIVHRDLKPANILFSKHGTPKVADMGLVLDRRREDKGADSALTRPGLAQGTPEYMSPEQARGRRDLDVRSDIYALGVTLFELVSGKRPFYGPDGMAVALLHCTTVLPDVRTVAPEATPRIAAVIARMTAKERDDRYKGAAELRIALESTRAESALVHESREVAVRAARARVGLRLVAVEALDLEGGRARVEVLLSIGAKATVAAGTVGLAALETHAREETGQLEEDGRRRVAIRIRATVKVDAHEALQDYPYDGHRLRFVVEHPTLAAAALSLVPDLERTGVDAALTVPGFHVERGLRAFERRRAPLGMEAQAGGPDAAAHERSQVVFELRIGRRIGPYAWRVGSAHLAVLALAATAPWIAPTVPWYTIYGASLALLASLISQLAADRDAPRAGGVTIADLHMSLARGYAIVALLIGVSVTANTQIIYSGTAAHFTDSILYKILRALLFMLPPIALLGAALLGFPVGKPLLLERIRAWRKGAGARVEADAPSEDDAGAAASASPSRPATRPRSAKEELVIGLLQEPTRLVHGCITITDQLVSRLLTEGPIEYDARLDLVPRLAREVPGFANGGLVATEGGGLRVTWRLREGLRWADGAPVVPEDALAAHALQPFPGLSTRDLGIEVRGRDIVLTYDGPRPSALVDLRLFPRGRLEEWSGEAGRARFASAAPPMAGPFKLASWTRGKELLLEANPHYLSGPPALGRVRIRIFDRAAALAQAFAAREVDLVPEGVLPPGEADALARRVPGADMRRRAAPNTYFLLPNHDDPVLADRRVRRALLLSIDREALVRVALDGYGITAHGWLPRLHEGFWEEVPRAAYDPQRAQALLDEAGYRAGKDGKRRGPDGRPLVLEVVRAERHPVEVVEYISEAAWRPLGIGVTSRALPEAEYFQEVLRKRRFAQLALFGYTVDPWETGRELWSEDRIPCAQNDFQGKNFGGWRSRAATDLHRRIDASFVDEERQDLFARQQRLWAEELPALPLYRPEQALLLAPGLEGVAPHAGGDHQLPWNAEEWRFASG